MTEFPKFPDANFIAKELDNLTKIGNFEEGYHLLYVPWETITKAKVAFVSLNPGATNKAENHHKVQEKSGNSYELEHSTSISPITKQFIELSSLLGVKPINLLTGSYVPFRSNNWKKLATDQKKLALSFSRRFWPLALANVKLIITCGNFVSKELVALHKMDLYMEAEAGWGEIKLKAFHNSSGQRLLALPHLSTYKLLSRKTSKEALANMLLLMLP